MHANHHHNNNNERKERNSDERTSVKKRFQVGELAAFGVGEANEGEMVAGEDGVRLKGNRLFRGEIGFIHVEIRRI